MPAGILKHKATIYNVTAVSDSQGGKTNTNTIAGYIWLGFIEIKDAEGSNEGSVGYQLKRKAIARYSSIVTKDSILVIDTIRYAVTATQIIDDRKGYMNIILEAI